MSMCVLPAGSMTFLFIYDKSLDIFALLREAFSIIGTFLGKKWGEFLLIAQKRPAAFWISIDSNLSHFLTFTKVCLHLNLTKPNLLPPLWENMLYIL